MTKKLKTKIKSKNASKKKEITKPFIKEELKIRLPKIVMYDSHPDSVYKSTGIALAKAIDGDKDEKLIALMKENIFKLDDFSIQH